MKNHSIDGDAFTILANALGQHSLWPAGKPVPDGWRAIGYEGSRADCMAHVDRIWTDLMPRQTD